MSKQLANSVEKTTPVAKTPTLHRINYPVIEIKDRLIRVTLDDAKENKVELQFQPYQAIKLTTQDCYRKLTGTTSSTNKIVYTQASAWLDELKKALRENDSTANFMDKALHFIVPAGDDMLEIAAWKIEVTHLNKTITFPEGVDTFPF